MKKFLLNISIMVLPEAALATSGIEHLASSIENLASSIQHPLSLKLWRTSPERPLQA